MRTVKNESFLACGYIPPYPVILYVVKEVPDQSMAVHRLIWAFITKLRLLKYIQNFSIKKGSFSDKNSVSFHISYQIQIVRTH